MRVACWPKGVVLLSLVMLMDAVRSDGGLPEGVEVVTSTSVSVRVSTSEDHVPRESVINQVVEKEKTQPNERKGATNKVSISKSVTKSESERTGTTKAISHSQSVTISALGPSTEAPKFRVRHKSASTVAPVVHSQAETTTVPSTTSPSPSTEAPKEAPRRKRKRPAGYRRPNPEAASAPQHQVVAQSSPVSPSRGHRPERDRKHSQVRPHQQFVQDHQQQQHQPLHQQQQQQQQQQHIELNRQPQPSSPQPPSPNPAQLPAQYHTPPPRGSQEGNKPMAAIPVPFVPPKQEAKQQLDVHPIRPTSQHPPTFPAPAQPAAPIQPHGGNPQQPIPTDRPRPEVVPLQQQQQQHPQVRPRPVQFRPQMHQALPIPRPLVTLAHNPPRVGAPASTPGPSSTAGNSLVHSNRPPVHLPPMPLPAIPPSHQEPVPLPPVPIKKAKLHKAKKQHRAPDGSVKLHSGASPTPHRLPIVPQPQIAPIAPPPPSLPLPRVRQVTLPPPTIPKQTATTAKSSFLSYFSFGKKEESVKPPEPVPVPMPLAAGNGVANQQPVRHHNRYHRHQHQHAAIDPNHQGGADLSFKEPPAKPQKFPKTTKSHKQSKPSKKYHPQQHQQQHFAAPPLPPARDEYPIPPAVPIPPPKYDEPQRLPASLESPQPVQTTVATRQTSYTSPPSPSTTRATPQTSFQTTRYQTPVETQRPYHHSPNYTPPPPAPPAAPAAPAAAAHDAPFIFGYHRGQQTQQQQQQQQQQVQYQHLPPQRPPRQQQQQQQQQHYAHQHVQQQVDVSQQFQQAAHSAHGHHQGQPQQQFVQSQTFSQQLSQQQQQQHQQLLLQQQQQQHQQQQDFQQQGHQQPQALLVQVPQNVHPGEQIELPPEMLKALGVQSVAPGVQKPADIGQNSASVVGHLSNGQGVVVLDEISNRPYVRPNSGGYQTSPSLYGGPVPVDVSKTPFTKGVPHGFPVPSKIQVDEKTQVSLSGVVLPHDGGIAGGLKTTYNELPPTQVNLNEPLNVHIPISQLPPRPAVNVRIKGPDGKVSEVLVPLHESNVKNRGFQLPPISGLIGQATHEPVGGPAKKYIPSDYYTSGKTGHSHRRLPIPHTQAFIPPSHQSPLFGAPSNPFLHYANSPISQGVIGQQDPLQGAASVPQSSWIGGWGSSIRNVGSRIGSIFSRKASSS